MNLSISSRLEKQRKKLHKEYLLKDLKDDKEEKLEKVWCFFHDNAHNGSWNSYFRDAAPKGALIYLHQMGENLHMVE